MGLFGRDSGVLGGLQNLAFGGETDAERKLKKLSTATFYNSVIQGFLPLALRKGGTDQMLGAGIQGIGSLINNPGGLSGNVADAIRPQLGMESQSIAQNFQNMQQQSAGAAARGNAPISIKNALSSALDVGQEREQRSARMGALTQSGQLQRQDMEQVYKLLDTILQFISSGRGQGIPGLASAGGIAQQRQATNQQAAVDMAQSFMSMMGGGGV